MLDELVMIFKLLAHPARLAILNVLRAGEECVCHMEAVLGYRQAYLSQQLAVLREAGIIRDRRDGWNIFYRVTRPEIYAILDAAGAMSGSRAGIENHRIRADHCPCPKCSLESHPKPEGDSIPLIESHGKIDQQGVAK